MAIRISAITPCVTMAGSTGIASSTTSSATSISRRWPSAKRRGSRRLISRRPYEQDSVSETTSGDSALVLFSGGQDSTTCLAWALDRFAAVETVGFDYGQ